MYLQARSRILISIFILFGATQVASADPQTPPAQVVERLHDALVQDMKNARVMGYAARLELVQPVADQVFDHDFAARKTIGRHWKELDRRDRDRWVETFSRATASSWVGRLHSYSGERFEILSVTRFPDGTAAVQTRFVRPHAPEVQLDYRLHQTERGWRIIDVYTDATTSQLALHRAEYTAILKRRGFEALLNAMELRMAVMAGMSEQPLAAAIAP